jgi:hypothetical protein
MKILIVDGPGAHPAGGPQALASAFRSSGHPALVHPVRETRRSWFTRRADRRRAAQVLAAHGPDLVHVFSADPALADSFGGHGLPVVHSTLDRPSRADVLVAPSEAALRKLACSAAGGEGRAICLPYTHEVEGDLPSPSTSTSVRLRVEPGDPRARGWAEELRRALKDVDVSETADASSCRCVVALASGGTLWPSDLAAALAAGRPVVAPWVGQAPELVLEGVTGYLSAPGDIPSLAGHVRYLLAEHEEADRMGGEARDEARTWLGGEAHVRTLLRGYHRAGTSRLAV